MGPASGDLGRWGADPCTGPGVGAYHSGARPALGTQRRYLLTTLNTLGFEG